MGLFKKNKKREEEKPKLEDTSEKEVETSTSALELPKGEDARSYGMILSPHITEKGTIMESLGKYIFKVASKANKSEIKKAIEKLYEVRVRSVNILRMPSKFRQVGKYEGKRPGFKKAIVTLEKGERIEISK
jgi:large subunit ribosomal protein L23